jgi:hypothetical protein
MNVSRKFHFEKLEEKLTNNRLITSRLQRSEQCAKAPTLWGVSPNYSHLLAPEYNVCDMREERKLLHDSTVSVLYHN